MVIQIYDTMQKFFPARQAAMVEDSTPSIALHPSTSLQQSQMQSESVRHACFINKAKTLLCVSFQFVAPSQIKYYFSAFINKDQIKNSIWFALHHQRIRSRSGFEAYFSCISTNISQRKFVIHVFTMLFFQSKITDVYQRW